MNVIDSLFVKIGIDSSGFQKGRKEVEKGVKDTERAITASAEEIGSAIASVTSEFIGLFIAVKGLADVIDAFKQLNQTIWQLGVNSGNLGIATSELRDWQEVAELAGGSAADATQSVAGFQEAIFNLKFKGQFSDQLLMLQRLGVQFMTTSGQMLPFKQILFNVASAMDKMGWDRATKFQYAESLGLKGGLATAVAEGTQALRDYYAEALKAQQINDKNAKAAQILGDAWVNLKYSLAGAAAQVLTNLTPALKSLLDNLAKITPAQLQGFADWLKAKGPGIMQFFSDLNTVVSGVASSLRFIINGVGNDLGTINSIGTFLGESAAKIHEFLTNKHYSKGKIAYAPTIAAASRQYGIPAGVLDRLISTESGYDPTAVSPKGAIGIAQFMPGTAKQYGVDPTNPTSSIFGAARYLADLYNQLGSWPAAIAAYNEGPGAYKAGKMPKETRNYVPKVLGPIKGALGAAQGAGPTPHLSGTPASRGTDVQIGSVTVNTQATDANGIAADMASALRRKFLVYQADGGVA